MTIIFFICLLVLQFLSGWGILKTLRFSLEEDIIASIVLSEITGLAIVAFIPFIMQLLFIPIEVTYFFIFFIMVIVAFLAPHYASFKEWIFSLRMYKPSIKIYEWVFILFLAFILFNAAWRNYYYPPLAQDFMAGPGVIAKYAIIEHTFINSGFLIDKYGNNNAFKPLSLTSLQVVYTWIGFTFGKVWLPILTTCFFCLLYRWLRKTLHPIIIGFFLVFFLATPEFFAYTVLVLYDYPNAVFYFIFCYFFCMYLKDNQLKNLISSTIYMGIAEYMRPETLILSCFFIPLLIFHLWKQKAMSIKNIMSKVGILIIGPFVFYVLIAVIYNNHYLPVRYSVPINLSIIKGLLNVSKFLDTFEAFNNLLIFSSFAIELYGYLLILFVAFFLLEIIIKKKLTIDALNWLYCILVIYVGIPFLAFMIPLFDPALFNLENTSKRAMFKIFPLLLFYLANNQILISLSEKIKKWEHK